MIPFEVNFIQTSLIQSRSRSFILRFMLLHLLLQFSHFQFIYTQSCWLKESLLIFKTLSIFRSPSLTQRFTAFLQHICDFLSASLTNRFSSQKSFCREHPGEDMKKFPTGWGVALQQAQQLDGQPRRSHEVVGVVLQVDGGGRDDLNGTRRQNIRAASTTRTSRGPSGAPPCWAGSPPATPTSWSHPDSSGPKWWWGWWRRWPRPKNHQRRKDTINEYNVK